MKMKPFKIYRKTILVFPAIAFLVACGNDDSPNEEPFVDTEAVYTVTDAKAVDTYVSGETLATVTDSDGGVTGATLESGFDLPAGTGLNASTGAITVTDPSLLVAGSYSLSITTVDSMSGSTLHSIVLTFDAKLLPLNINSGGGEVAFTDVTFSADAFFTGASTTFTATSNPEIANTEMDEIFRTERFGNPGATFGYEVELPNGDYMVTLHFAEIFWGTQDGDPTGGEGSRVFDVAIEGVMVLADYDIFSEVGANAATAKEYTVTVADGMMNIDFSASVDNPKISAIQIEKMP